MSTNNHGGNGNGEDNGNGNLDAVRRLLRRAGALVILGLLVEAGTLFWAHPTAFVFFATIGGGLVFLGIVVYFWAVLKAEPARVEIPPA